MFSQERFKRIDSSLISLLVVNILTIVIAIWNHWFVIPLLWIYWSQSVIIGFFNFLRMRKVLGSQAQEFAQKSNPLVNFLYKNAPSFFFLFHYGGFHFGYMISILILSFSPIAQVTSGVSSTTSTLAVLFSIVLFFMNHLFSYIKNVKNDLITLPSVNRLMFLPYIRIIPLHIFIMIGFFIGGNVVVFLVLKTGADLLMHQVTHSMMAEN